MQQLPTTSHVKSLRSSQIKLSSTEIYYDQRRLSQILKSARLWLYPAFTLTSTLQAQVSPDGPNPEPTALVSNNLPSSGDRIHHPTLPTFPCKMCTIGTYLQAVIIQHHRKTAPLNSSHKLPALYLRCPTSCASASTHESVI